MAVLSTRHQSLLGSFSFGYKLRLCATCALLVHEDHQSDTYYHCDGEEDQVYRSGVVVEDFVGESIEGGLREVEETSKADDKAVDFAECCKAENFGRVIPGNLSAM